MIHVILTTTEEDFCNKEDLAPSEEDFCSEWSFHFYLRMFSILLGDFAVEEYKQTTSIAVIFIFFIIFGVIILLNVLIALISDSYVHAKTSSILLFGRARVAVIAELNALESFLKPGYNPFQNLEKVTSALQMTGMCTRYVVVVFSYIGRWVVLLTLLGSAGIADYYLFERGYEIMVANEERSREFWWLALVYVFFFWLLFSAIWVIVSYLLTESFKAMVPDDTRLQSLFVSVNYFTRLFTNFITTRIFGLQQQRTINDFIALFERDDFDQQERTIEQWGERLAMLEESLKQSVRDTEQILMEQIVSSENRVDAVERNIRQEMRYQLTPLLKATKRRGTNGTRASGGSSVTGADGDGGITPPIPYRRNAFRTSDSSHG